MTEPTMYALRILAALSHERTRHVYGGTVPADVVAKRRARNKVARRSRRLNRLHAA